MALVRGADIVIEADLGVAPFILDRDHLDGTPPAGTTGAELTPSEDAWAGIECDVTSAQWSWGAGDPMGPLTECEAGRLRASLFDPDRQYDPSNVSSPYAGILRVGLPIRALVDGSPAWTGTLEDWSHDLGPAVSTLDAVDGLGTVASLILPTQTIPAGSTASQAGTILTRAGWPSERRRFEGGSAASRNAVPVEGSALEALMSVRFAEHAWLWATRDGSIGWRGRDEPYEPSPSVVVNCGGAGLGALASRFARDRVRNEVLIEGGTPPEYSVASITRHGPRTVRTTVADLAFSTALVATRPAPAGGAPRAVSQRITADRSSLLAQSGSTDLGGGQDDHIPSGYWNGYRMRGVIGFPAVNWSGITKVNSATLELTTTSFAHVQEGSTPRIKVYRVTSSWSPNSASSSGEGGSGWSTSGLVYPGPSATSVGGQESVAVPEGGGDSLSVDVTAIMRAVAPSSAGGSGAKWYGLRVTPFEESDSARNTEFYSAEASSGKPSILLSLETGHTPIAPTPLAPMGAGASAATFSATVTDPDGDAITNVHVTLYAANGTTVLWDVSGLTGGASVVGNKWSRPYSGPALVAGLTYKWKVRASDANGYGPWCGLVSFTIGAAPPPATPYPSWAQVILDQLAEPSILTDLGTITPYGPEVVPVVCAEFGDRWLVVDDMTSPPISRTVRVIGERVSIGPDRIEVNAVTEDVV